MWLVFCWRTNETFSNFFRPLYFFPPRIQLNPSDEFIILACDGIWDCLTNEQAVAYVRERINTKTPTEIGVEMLDEIISVDPRVTQGIGGDNMTVMVVDLQPHTREYNQASERE